MPQRPFTFTLDEIDPPVAPVPLTFSLDEIDPPEPATIGHAAPSGPSLADAAAVPVPDVLTPRGDIELPSEAQPMQGPMPMARVGPPVAPVVESAPMPLASALVPGRRLAPAQRPAAGFPSNGTLADLARGTTGQLPPTDYYTEVTAPAPPGSRAGDIAANVGKAGLSGLLAATTTQPWSAVEMSLDALGLREAASWAAKVRKDSQETRESLRAGQVGAGPTERAFYGGVESIGAMVPGIVATILTKNPAIGLGMMGVGTGTEKYAELKETAPHMTPVGRFLAGVVEGSAEVLTEKMPLDNLVGDLIGGSGVWTTIRRQVMAEVPGEQVATFTQDANEWAAVNPGKPVAAFLAERPGRGYETLVSTIVATVGMSAGSIALDRGLHKLSTADVVTDGVGGEASARTVQDAIDRALTENQAQNPPLSPDVPRETLAKVAPSPAATGTPSVVAPPSAPEDPAPVAAGSPGPLAQPLEVTELDADVRRLLADMGATDNATQNLIGRIDQIIEQAVRGVPSSLLIKRMREIGPSGNQDMVRAILSELQARGLRREHLTGETAISQEMEAPRPAKSMRELATDARTARDEVRFDAARPVSPILPPEFTPVGEEPSAAAPDASAAAPGTDALIDRVLDKSATGQPLGSPELRTSFEQRQALDAARPEAPPREVPQGWQKGPEGYSFQVEPNAVSVGGGVAYFKRHDDTNRQSVFYVGKNGMWVDGDTVNFADEATKEPVWIPQSAEARAAATDLVEQIAALPLGTPERKALQAQLREVVAGDQQPAAEARAPRLPVRPTLETDTRDRSVDASPAVTEGRLTRDQAFILRWIVDDLDQMRGERGGIMRGQAALEATTEATSQEEGRKARFRPSVGGTPLVQMFDELGVSASVSEMSNQIEQYLMGDRTKPTKAIETALRVAPVLQAAWNGERFDYTQVPEQVWIDAKLHSSQMQGPVSTPKPGQPSDLMRRYFGVPGYGHLNLTPERKAGLKRHAQQKHLRREMRQMAREVEQRDDATSFAPEDFEPETLTTDTLPTGEGQTRLPGEVGAVRDEERETPQEDLPQQTLTLDGGIVPDALREPEPSLLEAEDAPAPAPPKKLTAEERAAKIQAKLEAEAQAQPADEPQEPTTWGYAGTMSPESTYHWLMGIVQADGPVRVKHEKFGEGWAIESGEDMPFVLVEWDDTQHRDIRVQARALEPGWRDGQVVTKPREGKQRDAYANGQEAARADQPRVVPIAYAGVESHWRSGYDAAKTESEPLADDPEATEEPDEAPAPRTTPEREALIERIIAAARKPTPEIIESFEVKGTDGKWHRTTGGLPIGVSVAQPREQRSIGWSILTRDGTRVGTLKPTREEKLEDLRRAQESTDRDFRKELRKMPNIRLTSQAEYWLKEPIEKIEAALLGEDSAPNRFGGQVDQRAARLAALELQIAETTRQLANDSGERMGDGWAATMAQKLKDLRAEWERVTREGRPEPTGAAPVTASGITVRATDRNSVEIKFASKPSPEVLAKVKAAGYRWAKGNKVWYKKGATVDAARKLVGLDTKAAPAPKTEDKPPHVSTFKVGERVSADEGTGTVHAFDGATRNVKIALEPDGHLSMWIPADRVRVATETAPAPKTETEPPKHRIQAYRRADGLYDFMVSTLGERGHYDITGLHAERLATRLTPELAKQIQAQPFGQWVTYTGTIPPPEKRKTGPPSAWDEIGKNAAGQTIYENDKGVRSYVENGVRHAEAVGFVPGQGGVIKRTADGFPEDDTYRLAFVHPAVVDSRPDLAKEVNARKTADAPPAQETYGHAAVMSPGAEMDWWANVIDENGPVRGKAKSHGTGVIVRVDAGGFTRVLVFQPDNAKNVRGDGYVRLGAGQVEPAWLNGQLVPERGQTPKPATAPAPSATDQKRAELAAKRAAIKDKIAAKVAGIKQELKDSGTTLSSGLPVPPLGLITKTVELVELYAEAGIVDVQDGWLSFQEDFGEGFVKLRRAFELAWDEVFGTEGTQVATEPEKAQTQDQEAADGIRDDDSRGVDGAEPGTRQGARGERSDGRTSEGSDRDGVDGDGELDSARPERQPGGRTGARRGGTRAGSGAGRGDRGVGDRPAAGAPGPVHTDGPAPANYRITDDDKLGQGGAATKFKQNIAAIKLAKQIAAENRPATAEEQAILIKFVGWGGLKRELADAERTLIDEGVLTKDEYHRAFQSTLNAHYTSPGVIKAMWQAVADLGFDRGRVLEPSMGVGHFFGLAPADLRPTAMFGVELDSLTGLIAQQLYPQSRVQITGFQDATLPDGYFDLAISNVPFGKVPVADPASKIPPFARAQIHNYFFAKALQKVRPGGLIAFITTHGTLDARTHQDVREYLGKTADFLGAIRLPDTAFKENAGTEVVTDIVFMRRRVEGEKPRHLFAEWTETEQKFKTSENPDGIPVSKYFLMHPERVIGKMAAEGTMYGGGGQELSVKHSGKDVPEQAAKALKGLTDQILANGLGYQAQDQQPTAPAELAPDDVIEQMFYVDDKNVLRQRLNGQGEAVTFATASDSETNRRRYEKIMRSYIGLRDHFRALVAVMRDPDATDRDVAKARVPMTKAYAAFVEAHGPLHKAQNAKRLVEDPFGPAVLAIEDWNPQTETASKAAIFTKRTVLPEARVETADSPAHALLISLSETGGIDWTRIAGLMGVSIDEAKDALTHEGRVFETPSGRYEVAERYLSGRVRDKLALARDAAAIDNRFARNVTALEAVQPVDLPESRITVSLGAPWIPEDVINDFIRHLGGKQLQATYKAALAEWTVAHSYSYYDAGSGGSAREWETRFAGIQTLMQETLNNQQVVIRNRDGSVDEPSTVEAQGKQDAIRKEFAKWAWGEAERAKRLVRGYNDTHNATVLPTYDGSHLKLPGMTEHWRNQLRPHQVNAIWRAILDGNTYLAHTMGAGKTVVLAAIAMEYRRMGLAKKPVIVIPKQTLSDYAKFAEYYPNARVLIGTKEQTQGAARKQFMARIATGDWDAIIITRDAMKMMPAGDQAWADYLTEQIDELKAAASPEEIAALNAPRTSSGGRRTRLSDLARAIERLEQKLKEIQKKIKARKDQGLAWEDLGIDMILADEAHAYRKLQLATQLDQVAGVPVGAGSGFTNDMYIKVRQIQKLTPTRGLVMASGTPLVNSVAELYVLQKFLQPEALKLAGVDKFDAWAATFGSIVTKYEADVTGTKLKLKRRFSEFANINGLIQTFRSVMDVMLPEDLNLPTPPVTGGTAAVVTVDAGPKLKAFIQDLAGRVARLDPRDRRADNMLKISGDGQKAALDLRLVGIEPGGQKLEAIAANVLKKYREWDKQKGTQLVFMELGVPGGATFPTYDALRDLLVKGGMKPSQIAYIQDANTDARRDALMARMRSGEIRVMIGARATMGTGVNVQARLVAMHHADPHWLPALIEQADGRGIRQGNRFYMEDSPERVEGFTMDVTHYVTKASFDAYMWSAVARKAHMINQALRGNLSLDRIEEIGGGQVFDASEIAAIASDNPIMLERATLERTISNLQMMADAHTRTQRDRRDDLARMPERIAAAEQEIAALTAYQQTVKDAAIVIDGATLEGKDADKAVRERFAKVETVGDVEALPGVRTSRDRWGDVDAVVPLGTIGGRTLDAWFKLGKTRQGGMEINSRGLVLDTPRATRYRSNGLEQAPVTRLINDLADEVPMWISSLKSQAERDRGALEDAKKNADAPFKEQDDLDAALKRLREIEDQLGKNTSEKRTADEPTADEDDTTDEDDDEDDGPAANLEPPRERDRRGPPSTKRKAPSGNASSEASAPEPIAATPGRTAKVGRRHSATTETLDATRPIELPEVLEFARELQADVQVVKRFRSDGKTGDFQAGGLDSGKIRLRADLFKPENIHALARTLAHEIGHLVDWFPDRTLKRGNLLGHLKSMQSFLKGSFATPDGKITLPEVRTELLELSKLWRGPWTEDGGSYDKYRRSAKELYADALSVLLNNPGLLEKKAPTFYRLFFEYLDLKPEVKTSYFALQELLSGTREELIARREANVDRMLFGADAKAIDVERLRRAEREKGDEHYWLRFRVQHVDKKTALIDRVKALEKKGIHIPEEDDPRYLLEERSYMGGKQKAFLERFIQPLHVAMREAGIDWMTFGKALFYERIIAGDRSDVANPLGLAPDSARELYAKLQQGLSPEQMTSLGQAVAGFRAVVKGVAEDAYDAGLYKDDLYEQMQKNPAYVAFRVVDYMERDMTSTVHHQIGTLKDIQNPADATVLKMLVTMRAAEYNRMKVASFDVLGTHFPAEIQDAKHVWNGKGIVPVEPDDPKTQVLVTYREKGRLRGKYVDPFVAASLNNESVGRNWAVVEALRWINGKVFRPAFTGLNLGFQTFNFSRDFWRFWKNMPEMSFGRAMKLYRKAGTLARVRAYGLKPNATAKQRAAYADLVEAEGAGILSLTFNDIIAGRQTEDTQIEELYAQHGIGGTPTPHRGPLKAVYAIAEWIKNTGDFIETLPKAAAIYQFQGDGAIGDISAADRSFIRRKVGSPDFLAGGTYKPITNEVLLFSNAILQAWRADFEVATDPKTRSGFWWKTAMVNVAPKLAIAAFLASALGMGDDDDEDDATTAGLKQLRRALEGISEYDLTNYLSVPLGIDSQGNTVYVRMPQDDSGRLIGGLVWKALHLAQGDVETAKTLGQVFDYMAGQAPGVTPIIQAVGDVATFASGRNPYDPFRNRFLFTEDEMKAGGLPALKKFIGYEFQQFGGSILWKFYPGEDVRPRERTTTQKILELPIVSTIAGRWIKVSSFGHVEKLRDVQAGVQRDEARARAKERSAVADALRTFQKEPPPNRTRATQSKLAAEVVNRLYADASPKEREAQYRDVLKKIRMGAARGQADPIVDTVMSATSTAQRVAIVREAFKGRPAEMERWVRQAVHEEILSKQAAAAIMQAEP